jgi:O-antigen/teichoic acid export membrane protein
MVVAPALFGVVLEGKFSSGLAVLPGVLTYCVWFGMAMVSHNYLWCAEKARLATLSLLAGLAVKVGLSLVLLPTLGLLGAVVAACAAHFLALVLILAFGRSLGWRTDLGMWIVMAVPVFFWLGAGATAIVLAGLLAQTITTDRILTAEEKSHLVQAWLRSWRRWHRLRSAPS